METLSQPLCLCCTIRGNFGFIVILEILSKCPLRLVSSRHPCIFSFVCLFKNFTFTDVSNMLIWFHFYLLKILEYWLKHCFRGEKDVHNTKTNKKNLHRSPYRIRIFSWAHRRQFISIFSWLCLSEKSLALEDPMNQAWYHMESESDCWQWLFYDIKYCLEFFSAIFFCKVAES